MKKRILIIDDEKIIVKSLEKLLSKNGYEVIGTNTGLDAIMIFEEMDVDLVISDIKMPWTNGIDTIKELFHSLESKNKPVPPVIFITGYADKDLEEQAKELKPVAYIHKPFDTDQFITTIKDNLE